MLDVHIAILEASPTVLAIQFNTGRRYTAEGQVVTAKFDGELRRVLFHDHSRMVAGVIPLGGFKTHFDGALDLREFVMANYDMGNYGASIEAGQLLRKA
jgi:hypothetical protein